MSQKGKRQRLSKEENKEDENVKIKKELTMPTGSFMNEVVLNVGNAKKDDTFGYFVELGKEEKVPEGKSIPKNRPSTIEEIQNDMKSIRVDYKVMKTEISRLEKQMSGFVKSHFEKFENLVTQLGISIQEIAVHQSFKDSEDFFKESHPTFDNVIKSKELTKDEKDAFFKEEKIKAIASATYGNPWFHAIRKDRNTINHPSFIDIEYIKEIEQDIDPEYLKEEVKQKFLKTKAVFKKIMAIKELDNLIDDFNNMSHI